jgi:UDP-N-acetylmuramate dehydrogenase
LIGGLIITDKLANEIQRLTPALEIRLNEPMSAHTSFRIGGPAPLMLFPKSRGDLIEIYEILNKYEEKPLLIGNGSNVLAPDGGLDRAVIITTGVNGISVDGGAITAECGAPLTKLALAAAAEELAGLEFIYGIPGSVGGALVMNAGAYGGEMKDVVIKTEFLRETPEIRSFTGAEHCFGYRTSAFGADDVILRTYIKLNRGSADEIKGRMETLMARRKASQPLDMPSAGSAFKRPIGGYAADLIERAGLKGYAIGGAMVSKKHTGFIVNTGGASSDDVRRLIEHIQKTVHERFNIELQPEIKIL